MGFGDAPLAFQLQRWMVGGGTSLAGQGRAQEWGRVRSVEEVVRVVNQLTGIAGNYGR